MIQKPKSHGTLNLIFDERGAPVTDPVDIANILADQYEAASSDKLLTDEFLLHRASFEERHESIINSKSNSDDAYEPFTMKELLAAFAAAKDTAP